MKGIDSGQVDELIVKTFGELKRSIDNYSKGSVEIYSSALRSLTLLRQQVVEDEGGDT